MARFLVAPDSFKGTFEATAVAAAIAAGLRAGGAEVVECPLGDGGEGTAAVLLAARGGEWVTAPAHDPLGRPLEARFALLGDGGTAVVETAAASGLALLDRSGPASGPAPAPSERGRPLSRIAGQRSTTVDGDGDVAERDQAAADGEGRGEEESDAERADTFGTGELIVAAVAAGARRVLVGAGGSATTDGGRGALGAIAAAGGLGDATVAVLCDVTTPFEDAARVFGPQKGADPAAVARLSARLERFAAELPRDPRGVPMSGCAGGLSGGLWAALGAELLPGAEYVMEATGFAELLAGADAVISGEGAIDSQSFEGKVVGRVAAACAAAGVPLHVLAGRDDLAAGPERDSLASIRATPTLAALEATARELAAHAAN
jgi:glycerate kinase